MLMAGLDGIQNKIDPGEPLDKDIYALSPEELKEVPTMPGSLDEALEHLEADHEFLLKGDVFTKDVIETWIDYKRENEVDAGARCARTRTSSSSTTTCESVSDSCARPGRVIRPGLLLFLEPFGTLSGGHSIEPAPLY